jgi:ubiquinone/menaquinone biosynthesis C-methylase UbiE/diadenosine tetraphosphate (Ap4A) HIT family hydrolase
MTQKDVKYEITRNSYDKIANSFAAKHSDIAWIVPLAEEFVKELPLPKGALVLDAGCGPGRDAKLLSELGMTVIGIDFSEEMVRLARSNTGLEILLMDFRDLDFSNGFFDGIWANACIHHLVDRDIDLVLSEFYRVLKPNGVIFISAKRGTGDTLDQEYGKFPRYIKFHWKRDLITALEESGFKIISSNVYQESINPQGWIRIYARKPIDRQTELSFGCRMCEVVRVARRLSSGVGPWNFQPCDIPILETQKFLVCPALGQIVEGYTLIISKQHIPSLGALSAADWDELEELKVKVRSLIEPIFNSVVFLEHGSVSELLQAGTSVVHTHLHAVPAPLGFVSTVLQKLPFKEADARVFSKKSYLDMKPYLMIEDENGNCYVYNPPPGLPSQFLRRCLARSAGLGGEWHWLYYPHEDKIMSTIERLQPVNERRYF